MNRSIVILLTLFFGFFNRNSFSQINPNPSALVNAFITSEMAIEHLPGVATLIIKDDKVVWNQSYGFADIANSIPVTDTTAFLLASVSKVFTGTAAMQLREQGLLNLDINVNQYLPWMLEIPGFATLPVTCRQLMTHTSSIQDNDVVMDTYYDNPDPSISLADCMQRYFSTNGADYDAALNFLPNAPGTIFTYSNMATALNGYIVERASNTPFDAFCKANIFNKLCMRKTNWFMADFDSSQVARPYQFVGGNYVPYAHYGFADYPDGQLRSTVKDLANFMIAFLNGGTMGSNSILTSSSITDMWTVQNSAIEPNQGLNWYREEFFHSGGSEWLWGHSGGEQGVSTHMYFDPAKKIAFVVLTNGEGDALSICDELYDYALTLNSSTGYEPVCVTSSVVENHPTFPKEKKLLRIVDVLGREVPLRSNMPLLKVYTDGSVEKVFVFE